MSVPRGSTSADELAEKVQASLIGYTPTLKEAREASDAALSELVRRASERDQAVRERDEALRVIAKVRRTWKVRADRLATAPADQEQT